MLEERLLEIKEDIDQAKISKAEAEGRIKGLQDDLAKMGFGSVEEAQAETDELQFKIAELEKKLKEYCKEIGEEYDL